MTEDQIKSRLQKLSELEHDAAIIEAPYQERLDLLRRSIEPQVSSLTTEMAAASYAQRAEAQALANEIEQEALAVGHTVKIDGYMAVYYKPSFTWPKAKLEGFAAAHPELYTIAEKTAAKIQIRRGK